MRIVQFKTKSDCTVKVGILKNEKVVDVNANTDNAASSLVELLTNANALDTLKTISENPKVTHNLSDVTLVAPINKPDKIVCIGLNYKDHCDETNSPYPKEPMVFSKYSSTIIGPNENIVLPINSKEVDWEVELTVVIGKKAKHVKKENAFDHVLGYTIAQDISARDWQQANGGQFLLGKSMDTFCPIGPCIVTKDEIKDPHNLNVKTTLNGVVKQSSNTKQLIHRIDKLIEHVSSVMTLYPGDIILTGTPGGVGFKRSPPEYLKNGDILETEIESIGVLINKVIDA